tara:strand:+ start:11257 stop:11721 length:465 start_codon:yes stop_codon:yes gene_type:complete
MKYSIKEKMEFIKKIKSQKLNIVFTNGCFDILHVGHTRYLNRAKELGDFLVVGLNSDSSVRENKGSDRPINKFNDRAKILSCLKAVDLVIKFEEKTPLKLIRAIMPDILVKGGDYKIEDIVGSDEVIKQGGKVIPLGFYEGYSSSKYIKRIKKH